MQKEHLPFLLTSVVMFLCMSVLPLSEIRENTAAFTRQTDMISVNSVYLFDTFFDHEDLKYVFHTRYPEKIRYVYAGKFYAPVDYDAILPSFLQSFRRYLPENGKTRHYYEKMFPYINHKKFAAELREGDAVIFKKETEEKLRALLDKNGFCAELVIEGDLGHREFVFIRVGKKSRNGR